MTFAAKLADAPALDDSAFDADAEFARVEKAPDAFRTIGEAAGELGLKTHVLRFWETKFPELKPMKRPDGRRFYRPEDMALLRRLQELLHVRGLTIRGAIRVLNEKGVEGATGDAAWSAGEIEVEGDAETDPGLSVRELQETVREAVERGEFAGAAAASTSGSRARLERLLSDLTGLKSRLDAVRMAG